MSSFDIFTDAPGMLRAEASNITIKFDRTGPTTARISWNIPSPAAGCAADQRAYDGMLVTIDTTPTSATKLPKNGTKYESDVTVDANLFAGDRLGTSLVVGAFYNDTTTMFVDVTNLSANANYYVTGFPVDAQSRYYVEGVHAYSMSVSNQGTADTHGHQVVVLNPELATMGVGGTDSTGLVTGQNYTFSMQVGLIPRPRSRVDSTDCVPVAPTYTVTVDGTNAQTYADLVREINRQLSAVNNAPQSVSPPNTGTYYWNSSSKKLFQWNGYINVPVTGVIVQSTAPTSVAVDSYWLNTTTNALQKWNGSAWISITVISGAFDPAAPTVDRVWFNGTSAYTWNGVTWCQTLTHTQTDDPSNPIIPDAGSFWYDSSKEILYRWNTAGVWQETTAVQYFEDPNALSNGAYWFNETNNKLYAYGVPSAGWNEQSNVAVSEHAPTSPAPGKFWYNPVTLELQQRNVGNTAWVSVDVIPFPVDPTVRSFCDVWWNTQTSVLSVWDGLNSVWIQATRLYTQGIDPTVPVPATTGDVWFNPTTGKLSTWNGYCYVPVDFINWPTDPTNSIVANTVWFNSSTNVWQVRTLAQTWATIEPIASASDPNTLAPSTLWFNTTNNALSVWNGISWIPVTYVTTPVQPTKGALWFNMTSGVLMTWNGDTWVVGTPVATVELDCHGNLLFMDTTPGSLSFISLTDGDLFASLTNQFAFHDTIPGTDGASDVPTYEELGIGTTGNNDARRQLQNEIRYELGYPVVDVELTPEQLDYIVDKGLSELRSRSSIPYKRGFFFMEVHSETQVYYLTNKIQGMNKIVDILGVYRTTSSFLSSAHGAGVYGQIVLQHMYNMGTFDLLSYHIMSEYTKLMEMLFAARITFSWNEQSRQLFLHHRFPMNERTVCIEATTERSEQDMLTDRYIRAWMRRYCLATARLILAETRGKFSTLPGASGSVTLNASELRQASQQEIEACLQEIEDYVVDKPDEFGMGTQFVFG